MVFMAASFVKMVTGCCTFRLINSPLYSMATVTMVTVGSYCHHRTDLIINCPVIIIVKVKVRFITGCC